MSYNVKKWGAYMKNIIMLAIFFAFSTSVSAQKIDTSEKASACNHNENKVVTSPRPIGRGFPDRLPLPAF